MKAKKAELAEEKKRIQLDAKQQQEELTKTFEALKATVSGGLDLAYVTVHAIFCFR